MVLESSEDGNKAVGEKQGDTPCSRFFFLFAESEQNRMEKIEIVKLLGQLL